MFDSLVNFFVGQTHRIEVAIQGETIEHGAERSDHSPALRIIRNRKFRNQFHTPEQIAGLLKQEQGRNPNLIVYIRADKDSRYDLVAQVIDGCQKNGITRYSLRTDPTTK